MAAQALMMEGQGSRMLDHQRTASVGHLVLSSLLTMLPVLTYGALQSYLTIGLPQLLEQNPTGILLDLNKMSWISKKFFVLVVRNLTMIVFLAAKKQL